MNWHHLKQHIDKGRFSCDFERRALACAYDLREQPTIKQLAQRHSLKQSQVRSIKECYNRAGNAQELISGIQRISKRYQPTAPKLTAEDRGRLQQMIDDTRCPDGIKHKAQYALLCREQTDEELQAALSVSQASLDGYKRFWRQQTSTDELWDRYQSVSRPLITMSKADQKLAQKLMDDHQVDEHTQAICRRMVTMAQTSRKQEAAQQLGLSLDTLRSHIRKWEQAGGSLRKLLESVCWFEKGRYRGQRKPPLVLTRQQLAALRRAQKHSPGATIAAVIRMQNGEPVARICEELGVSRQAVYYMVGKLKAAIAAGAFGEYVRGK